MTLTEYEKLAGTLAVTGSNPMQGYMLKDLTPRTLLYGYTLERDTFHVYLDDDGEIKTARYTSDDFLIASSSETRITALGETNALYIPSKRVYPAASDFEFCSALISQGYQIPFTTFKERVPVAFHGRLLEECLDVDLAHPINFELDYEDFPLEIWDKAELKKSVLLASESMRVWLRTLYLKAESKKLDRAKLNSFLQNVRTSVEWHFKEIAKGVEELSGRSDLDEIAVSDKIKEKYFNMATVNFKEFL